MVTATVIDEVNAVNVLTDRVMKRKDEYLAAKPQVCAERTRLITESWKETEDEPIELRWAKAFDRVLEGIPIAIFDDELIVGSQTKYVRGAYPYLENSVYDNLEELNKAKPTMSGDFIFCDITEADKESLLKDAEYWKGKEYNCQ